MNDLVPAAGNRKRVIASLLVLLVSCLCNVLCSLCPAGALIEKTRARSCPGAVSVARAAPRAAAPRGPRAGVVRALPLRDTSSSTTVERPIAPRSSVLRRSRLGLSSLVRLAQFRAFFADNFRVLRGV